MILAILQARFSSSRLPGKVLEPILGKPMLLHQIERISRSRMIDKLVIATSIDISDDPIEELCLSNNIKVFRGDLDNVLKRYFDCAKVFKPSHIVRLTGDCPLLDWQIIDEAVQTCIHGNFDYLSTDNNLPDGINTEVMTLSALQVAHKNATLPSEKEHVTQYIRKRPKEFNLGVYSYNENLSHLRFTVDEPEDLMLVKCIYKYLIDDNPQFLLDDILMLLKKYPDLEKINNKFERDEGLLKSQALDKQYINNV